MFEPQFLVRQILGVRVGRHRRRKALVEQFEASDSQLDFARRQLRVVTPGRPLGHFACHLDHVFGPQRFALVDQSRGGVSGGLNTTCVMP